MNPYMAYLLGLLTFIIVFFPIWILSSSSYVISQVYFAIVCSQAASYLGN